MQYHEYANLFPMMSADERARLLDDMHRNGYDESAPIVTYQGKILDGRNRYEVAQELGIYPPTVEYEGGDALQYVIRHNLNRRHLSESQRAVIAARLETMKHGGARNFQDANLHLEKGEVTRSEAADLLNVSPRMVASAKAIERSAPELMEIIEAGGLSINSAQNIAKLPEFEREPIVEQIKQGTKPHVSYNSGENEWYTPALYIEAAWRVMGRIDIDPASSEIANRTVRAGAYYDKEMNGLSKVWAGNIWMNPPYSGDLIGKFCDKLKQEYDAGRVTAAIVLVNNATETNWFGNLISIASAVVFTKGRVKFLDPQGNPGAPLQGQAIIYIGENPSLFIDEFSLFGGGALCAAK